MLITLTHIGEIYLKPHKIKGLLHVRIFMKSEAI